MEYRLTAPMTREQARQLRCGDTVLFTGTIYTARDAAHKRLVELLDRGEPLPLTSMGRSSTMRVPRLRKRGMQSDPAVRPPVTVWMHMRPRSLPPVPPA